MNGISLREKIAKADAFFVLATKNYIDGIKKGEKGILESLKIGKELKKDTVVLIDEMLNPNDLEILEKQIYGLNIRKKIVGNLKDENAVIETIKEYVNKI